MERMLGKKEAEGSAEQTQAPPPGVKKTTLERTADKPVERREEIGALPLGERVKSVAPPLKPYKKGSRMANPPSPSYRPEIPRKVVDIPNPSRLQAQRADVSHTDDSSRLVVGKSISVSGDISSCEALVVQGTVEANLTEALTIEVAEGGLFKGTAEVDHAVISGTFEGTLKARLSLDVGESGHINGTLYYKDISIAPGGRVQGTIDSIESDSEDSGDSGGSET